MCTTFISIFHPFYQIVHELFNVSIIQQKSSILTWLIWPIYDSKVFSQKHRKLVSYACTSMFGDEFIINTFSTFSLFKGKTLISYLCQSIYLSRKFSSDVFCFRQTFNLPPQESLLLFDGLVINLSSKHTTNRRLDVNLMNVEMIKKISLLKWELDLVHSLFEIQKWNSKQIRIWTLWYL